MVLAAKMDRPRDRCWVVDVGAIGRRTDGRCGTIILARNLCQFDYMEPEEKSNVVCQVNATIATQYSIEVREEGGEGFGVGG